MTDEFYYLDSTHRLGWGFVDHPPFCVALLALLKPLIGDSLLALRAVSGLIGAGVLVLTGLLARELGGGRAAQWIAGGLSLGAPMVLAMSSFYSMNVIDLALTAGAALLVARLLNGGDARLWWVLGGVLGMGLLNKYSMLWFGFALGVGLVATPRRAWLATPGPWIAAGLALALFAPHLLWQWRMDFPTVEFLQAAASEKLADRSVTGFLRLQLVAMGPLLAPFWVGGLVWLFVAERARPYRLLGWIFVVVAGVLAATGSARIYYLAPLYAIPLAAGGAALEDLARRLGRAWLVPAGATLVALGGVSTLAFSVPVVPASTLRGLIEASGAEMPHDSVGDHRVLPTHLALQHHGGAIVAALVKAYDALPAHERAEVGILTDTFGSAGAVNVLARERLPSAASVHNHYWLWGPGDVDGQLLLVFWARDREHLLRENWEEVTEVGRVECANCASFVTSARAIYRVRGIKRRLREIWPEFRLYL